VTNATSDSSTFLRVFLASVTTSRGSATNLAFASTARTAASVTIARVAAQVLTGPQMRSRACRALVTVS